MGCQTTRENREEALNKFLVFFLVTLCFSIGLGQITTNYADSTKPKLDTLPPHLAHGPLAPGWEKRINYTAESNKRLFWVASSGEPKWAEIRNKAESTLVKRDSLAVPFLLTKLSTDDARQRQTVNQILKKIGKDAVKPLLAVVDTAPDFEIATLAIATLGDIGDSTCIPKLIKLSNDTAGRIRSSAVGALMTMPLGSEVITNRIRALALDPWSGIRRTALRGLILEADVKSVSNIVNALADSVWPVRETVIQALALKPTGKDSAKPERMETIKRFHNALRDTIEQRLLPDWTVQEFLGFRSGFGAYPFYRSVRKEGFTSNNALEVSMLLQAYRLLDGDRTAVWKRAAKYPAAVVRVEALRAGIHKSSKGDIDVDGFAKPLLEDTDPLVSFVKRDLMK